MNSKFKEREKFTMSKDALKNVECQEVEETYTVKKAEVSEMVVVLNDVEYNKEGETLNRVNNGFTVRIHFQENIPNNVKDIKNFLKEQYVTDNCKSKIGE